MLYLHLHYDTDNQERPKMCILLKSCQKLSQDCVGCHTGPPGCSNSEEECQFAIWSNLETGLLITETQNVRLISGEPNCNKKVKGLAVGGGGVTEKYCAGGGSGYVSMAVLDVKAHSDLLVIVGDGAMPNLEATASAVIDLSSLEEVINGGPGGSASLTDGGDGYSGGGAPGAMGGEKGEHGFDYGIFQAGNGSNFDISTHSFTIFSLTPGRGGRGEISTGGGGGGGVVIDGDGEFPTHHDYQGEGFGGGAGGFNKTFGIQGCVILEV